MMFKDKMEIFIRTVDHYLFKVKDPDEIGIDGEFIMCIFNNKEQPIYHSKNAGSILTAIFDVIEKNKHKDHVYIDLELLVKQDKKKREEELYYGKDLFSEWDY